VNILIAILQFISKVFGPALIYVSGRKSAIADVALASLKKAKERVKIDKDVANMSDDELDRELHDRE
jgi:hypothetical protein|tara:strand:+ start:1711 stop:1911 length:201 start_codon:yes stop_codon:yes gene_type:complete